MCSKYQTAAVGLLSVVLVAAGASASLAQHPGHGHGGGGFGGFHSGGGSGGHVGGHVGGWSGGHVGASPGHISSGTPGFAGHPYYSHASPAIIVPHLGHNAYYHSYPGHRETWNHAELGDHGAWNHDHGWWDHHYPYRNDLFGSGLWGWPWYSLYGGSGDWPNYYDYGYAPYGDVYGDDEGAVPYAVPYAGPTTAVVTPTIATPSVPPETGTEASDFYNQALAAFRQGDYAAATRWAAHAAVDEPKNQDVHLLAMLGLFALGQYRPAAMEAHAVAALGPMPDWPKLYGYYGNVQPYTDQLRQLEQYVVQHPAAPEGRFLLGLQYLIDGHRDAARAQFLEAVRLTPRDTWAAKLLTAVGGTPPTETASPAPPTPSATPGPSPH